LFNDVKRYTNKALNEIEDASPQSYPSDERVQEQYCEDDKCAIMPENFDEKLEEKIENNKAEKEEQIMDNKYVINIPNNAVKQDLIDLKVFMQTQVL